MDELGNNSPENPYQELDEPGNIPSTNVYHITIEDIKQLTISYVQNNDQTEMSISNLLEIVYEHIKKTNFRKLPVQVHYALYLNAQENDKEKLIADLIVTSLKDPLREIGISSISAIPNPCNTNSKEGNELNHIRTPQNYININNNNNFDQDSKEMSGNWISTSVVRFGTEIEESHLDKVVENIVKAKENGDPWGKVQQLGESILIYRNRAILFTEKVLRKYNTNIEATTPLATTLGTMQIRAWNEGILGTYIFSQDKTYNSNVNMNISKDPRCFRYKSRCSAKLKTYLFNNWEIGMYIISLISIIAVEISGIYVEKDILEILRYSIYMPVFIVTFVMMIIAIPLGGCTIPTQLEFDVEFGLRDHIIKTHKKMIQYIPNKMIKDCNGNETKIIGKFLNKYSVKEGHKALSIVLREYMSDPTFVQGMTFMEFQEMFALYRVTHKFNGFNFEDLSKLMEDAYVNLLFNGNLHLHNFLISFFISSASNTYVSWGMPLLNDEQTNIKQQIMTIINGPRIRFQNISSEMEEKLQNIRSLFS